MIKTDMPTLRIHLLLFCLPFLLLGCQEQMPLPEKKPELLIYCGITMGKAIQELADRFEQNESCLVKIIQGGSGNLYRSILINRSGDLFLPGSESYIRKARSAELVTDTATVGTNRATFVVAKGNPLKITTDINCLLDPNYRIVLGSAESGSIGKETKRLLTSAGIYQQALDRTLYLTSDSKGLSEAIRSRKADLTINWLATTRWAENRNAVDAIPLPISVAPSHQLILGLLKYSQQPGLARKFMAFTASPEGQVVFSSFGLGQ